MTNPLLWRKTRKIWSYGIAILSVSLALLISQWPLLRLEAAPVSLFLCAVMITAWFGGIGPGLVAPARPVWVFVFFFLRRFNCLFGKLDEIPGLLFLLCQLCLWE